MVPSESLLVDQVKSYSDVELREKLTGLGEDIGPITGTTRVLYERKLIRLLTGTRSEFSDEPPSSPPRSPRKSPSRQPPSSASTVNGVPDAIDGSEQHTMCAPALDSTINLIRARKPVSRTAVQEQEASSVKSTYHQSSPFPAARAQFRRTESAGSAMDHVIKFALFAVVIAVIVFMITNQSPDNALEHKS